MTTEPAKLQIQRLGPAAQLAHFGLLFCTGAILLWWSWLKWPDVLIDYGSQLYIPWQILEGQRLYVDLIYGYGPLAPYASALWFSLFGVGLTTLVWTNVAVLACVTLLFHSLLRRFSSPVFATAACVSFLVLFAFGHWRSTGNYNFITPYETNITYGLLFSLGALECLARYVERERPAMLWLCGVSSGIVFLTKLELFAAVAPAVGVGLLTHLATDPRHFGRAGWRCFARPVAVLTIAALLPVVLGLALLTTQMSMFEAASGTLGSLRAAMFSSISSLPFYQVRMGTDDVAGNLRVMLESLAGGAAVVLALYGASLLALRPVGRRGGEILRTATFLATAGAIWWTRGAVDWDQIARPLPFVVALILARGLLRLWHSFRAPLGADARLRELAVVCLATFALGCLLKMALNVGISHYGFVLTAPATLLTLVALLDWIPKDIERRGGPSWLYRGVVTAMVAMLLVVGVLASAEHLSIKTVEVGSGPDRFLADGRGKHVNAVLGLVERYVGEDDTVFAMPEGVMINYLARRRNSTPYTILMPASIAMRGESKILQALEQSPPDYVLLVHKDTAEFGYRFFGEDYAHTIARWVKRNYRATRLVGNSPLQGSRFGILLLERRGASQP